ncbi:MAG: PaaI family thioesterase [Flavobacteriales bacterium]|nr:PaaI family thioesterase [Flavobacteriales bacterium]
MHEHHYRKLEQIYYGGPINQSLLQKITVSENSCTIEFEVQPSHFHAGMAMHGAMYFKLLDDSAYFACSSREEEFFILTTRFEVKLLRPVSGGKLFARGTFLREENNVFYAESEIRNEENKLVATGSGEFVRSKIRIASL